MKADPISGDMEAARLRDLLIMQDELIESLRAEVKRLDVERASLLRCSKGHIHNQAYGRPCPICERDALRDGLEKLACSFTEKDALRIAGYAGDRCFWEDEKKLKTLADALSAAQALLSGAAPVDPSADPDSPTGTADDAIPSATVEAIREHLNKGEGNA